MFIQEIIDESLIDRPYYTNKISKYLWSPLIKVLIWQRRVGKSSILKLMLQKLYKQGLHQNNIFYINKELPLFDHIKTYEDLKNEFQSFLWTIEEGRMCIWLDEIQEILWWEKFVTGILAQYQEKVDIFITWSNSFLLSGELATYITWRYIEFSIFSLDFQEFCVFKKGEKNKENFLEYLKYGGLPALFKMEYSDNVIFPYLLGVYNTIVLKDIIQYHHIKNIAFFRDFYKYVLANIWNIISGKSIKDYLKSQNISLWNDTVLNFLHYAEETFLLHKVYSVNPETKKFFEIYNKYYVTDFWLRNALVGIDFKRDIWKLIENYLFLELKKHDYQITIWRLKDGKEIDFIAIKNGVTKYFQVCYLLASQQTIEREYSPLKTIHDNREKYVVSFDDINLWIHQGIHHINILDIVTIL